MRASPRTSPPSRPLTRPSFLQRRALKSGAVAFPHSDPRSALPVSSDDPERPALRRGHLARPRPLATPAEVAAGSCPAARCSGPGTAVPSPRPVPWASLSWALCALGQLGDVGAADRAVRAEGGRQDKPLSRSGTATRSHGCLCAGLGSEEGRAPGEHRLRPTDRGHLLARAVLAYFRNLPRSRDRVPDAQ